LSWQRLNAAFTWTATASREVAQDLQAVRVYAPKSADTAGSVTGRARERTDSHNPGMSLKDKGLRDACKSASLRWTLQ